MKQFTTSDGINLSYNDSGQGSAIICLHGFLANKEYFADLSDRFSKRCRIIAYDQRCHGLSDDSPKRRSMEGLAEDLKELIEHLDLRGVVLLGESMGGMVVLQYVQMYGCENISRIILGDTTPRCINDNEWKNGLYFDGSTPLEADNFIECLNKINYDFEAFMDFLSTSTMRNLDPAKITTIKWPAVTRKLTADIVLAFFVTTFSGDQRKGLGRINVPTLIVHADPGSIFPPSTAKYMEENIKESKRVAIGNSHLFSLEEPERYFQEIETFLSL